MIELSFGSDVSTTSMGAEELVSWMAKNPEVVREGLCQIDGVRYIQYSLLQTLQCNKFLINVNSRLAQ